MLQYHPSMTIVTHPGRAHRDEFLAICFLVGAAQAPVWIIQRREATPEDLADECTVVVDTGGQHNPRKLNFDHHQLERDAPATCSLSLVLKFLNLNMDLAYRLCPWIGYTEILDSKGPHVASLAYGFTKEALSAIQSPVESSVLRKFGQQEEIWYHEPLFHLMQFIGRQYIDYFRAVDIQRDVVAKAIGYTQIDGIVIADMTKLNTKATGVSAAARLALEDKEADVAVEIHQDERGPGLTLLRKDPDGSRIDFSTIEDRPEISFAHKSGFIAKTTPGADWERLVALARERTQRIAQDNEKENLS